MATEVQGKPSGRKAVFRVAQRLASIASIVTCVSCSGGSNVATPVPAAAYQPSTAVSRTGTSSAATVVSVRPPALSATGQLVEGSALSTIQQEHAAPNVTQQNSLLPPAGTIYFGAYVNYLDSGRPYQTQTLAFEQQIGRTLGVHAEYYQWSEDFPGKPQEDDHLHGRVPVISWNCGATDYAIATGQQDALLIRRAQSFRAYGHRVMLRFDWEMNLPFADDTHRGPCIDPKRDTNGKFSPSDFIAAWRHMHAIFRQEGATNVSWLWCPSGDVAFNPIPYYPGDSFVDWVGFDHYDVNGTQGLDETLAPAYKILDKIGKPMMLGETGTAATAQARYLYSAPGILKGRFKDIRGFIYYDSSGRRQDWRLLSADALAAARSIGATAYFSGMVNYTNR